MPFLRTVARNVLTAICASSLFAFVLTLPFIDLGLWRQVETATVAIHGSAAFAALALALLALAGDRSVRDAVLSAPVLLLFAIGLLSFAFAPWHDDPARTAFGLLKHGIGGLWWISTAVLTAGFSVAGRGRARIFLAACAGIATASIIALYAFNWSSPEPRWIPYDFKEWVAILGLIAGVPLMALRIPAATIAGLALMALSVAFFGNRSIMLTVILVVAAATAWTALRSRISFGARPTLAASLALAAILGTTTIAMLPRTLEGMAVSGIREKVPSPIASEDPRDHVSIEGKSYGTIWSRGVILELVAGNIAEHPSSLLFGRGWGSLQEVVAEDGRKVPGRRFRYGPETASLTFLDFNANADFHSHNLLMESLLSVGLPGALLTLLAFLAPVLCARRRSLPAAGVLSATLLVAGSLWFLLGIMGPFLALAIASVGLGRPAALGRRLPVPAMAPVFAASGLGLLFCAVILLGFAKAQQQERWYFPLSFFSAPPCTTVIGPFVPERQIATGLYRTFVEQSERAGSPERSKEYMGDRRGNAINFACVMRRLADTKPSATVLATSLELRSRVLAASGNDPLFQASLKPDFVYWEADLRKLWTIAPGRTELVIPYVSWLLAGKDPKAAETAGRLAETMKAGDPVRSWLLARKAEVEGDVETQQRHLREALARGIANIVPISGASVERAFKAASR